MNKIRQLMMIGSLRTKMIRTSRVTNLHLLDKFDNESVYLAESRRRERQRRNWIAVKKLHRWPLPDIPVDQKPKFIWEARSLALERLRNNVALYSAAGDLPCMARERVPGSSLYDVLHSDQARELLPCGSRVIVAAQIAAAMERLHSKDIVYFDLKADNVLIDVTNPSRPLCKIADIGHECVDEDDTALVEGCGTLGWMAPEVLSGGSITKKADVYAFGIVMWELITGEIPYDDFFDVFDVDELKCAIVEVGLRPVVPEWCNPMWRALMEECWVREAERRPAFPEVAKRLRFMVETLAGSDLCSSL